MDIYREQFGRRLREARKRIPALTQEKLAEQLGVEGPSVSRWETGKDFPEDFRLPDICLALGVDAEYFAAPIQVIKSPLPDWANSIENILMKTLSNYETRLKEDRTLAALDAEVQVLREQNKRLLDGNALLSMLENLKPQLRQVVVGLIQNDPHHFRGLQPATRILLEALLKAA